MNIFKSPFARSLGGRTFATLMLLPLMHLFVSFAMVQQGINPGPTGWLIAAEVIFIYAVSVFFYRVEVALRAKA